MVVAGLTFTGVPLVMDKLPGVMTPVPLVKTAVRAVFSPAVIVAGFAAKLVIAGAGYTLTVTDCVIAAPVGLVTVRV